MDQVEATLTGDQVVVNDVVHTFIPKFASHGIEFVGTSLGGSPELQRFLIFHLLTKRTRLRIDISFFAASREKGGRFNVHIINQRNQKLSVKEYLNLHKLVELTRPFTQSGSEPDLRTFAASFLNSLLGLFSGELKPVLEGKFFEETPIDWMGYR